MKETTQIMKIHWTNHMYKVFIVSLLIALTACSTSKEKIFKEDMPTMKEIYIQKFNHLDVNKKPNIERVLENQIEPNDAIVPESPIASSYRALQKQFPKAPNPIMLMVIFPHLTHSGTPVPEYNTYFHLYEK